MNVIDIFIDQSLNRKVKFSIARLEGCSNFFFFRAVPEQRLLPVLKLQDTIRLYTEQIITDRFCFILMIPSCSHKCDWRRKGKFCPVIARDLTLMYINLDR